MVRVNEFETIVTHTGFQFQVRHLRTSDAVFLMQIFNKMSADSRYYRFNQLVDNFSDERKWQEAERIARINPQRSGGLIAFADLSDRPKAAIAGARYVCVENGVAEAAITVIDAVQKQGVGTQLMLMLVEIARQDGVKQLKADIRNDNEGIWKILHRLPYHVERQREGADSHVVVDLTRAKMA